MTDGWQRSDEVVNGAAGQPTGTWETPLGLVVEGSLGRGVEVRLTPARRWKTSRWAPSSPFRAVETDSSVSLPTSPWAAPTPG